MNSAKNVFSYVLWLLYAIIVGSGLFCYVTIIGERAGSNLSFTLCIGAGIVLVTGSFTILSKKLLELCLKHDKALNATIFWVVYALIFTILLGIGFFMREEQIVLCDQPDPFHYFDIAFVKTGNGIPLISHGIEYIYVYLLRVVCLIFGNYEFMCLQFQVILQLIGGALFCEAVRRLTGAIPALCAFAFFSLSPYWVQQASILQAGSLFLVLYSIVLLFAACWYNSKDRGIWQFMLIGACVGALTYFDVMGITLLIVLLFAFFSEMKNEKTKTSDVVYLGLLGISGFVLAVAACFVTNAIYCHKGVDSIVASWLGLYSPKPYGNGIISLLNDGDFAILILLVIALVGVFSFFVYKSNEKMNVWVLISALVIAGDYFGILTKQLNGVELLFLCIAVLAGVGCKNIYDGAIETAEKQHIQEMENETVPSEPAENINKKTENDGIQFIENPLPGPKKHEKKVMDYDYFVADDDDFDIQ